MLWCEGGCGGMSVVRWCEGGCDSVRGWVWWCEGGCDDVVVRMNVGVSGCGCVSAGVVV